MSYHYEFDTTYDGDFRLRRSSYEILQQAYRQLRDELEAWNRRTLEQGASNPPYLEEVDHLDYVLAWGEEQLGKDGARDITIRGISVGTKRYAKAALTLMMHRRQEDRTAKSEQGWPDAALRSLDDAIEGIGKVADKFEHEPSDVLWQLIPKNDAPGRSTLTPSTDDWDVFISHAAEDKEAFVRPLAQALRERGLSVWFDEFTLTVGDSLRRSIDNGLARSRFGIIMISPYLLEKEWPQKELDGLAAREVGGTKVILPVWHNITIEQLRARSPMLADRLATLSSHGIDRVVVELVQAMAAAVATTRDG